MRVSKGIEQSCCIQAYLWAAHCLHSEGFMFAMQRYVFQSPLRDERENNRREKTDVIGGLHCFLTQKHKREGAISNFQTSRGKTYANFWVSA